jgi:hypothetical protein
MNEWIKINSSTEMPKEKEFLLSDEDDVVTVGFNAFDFYDAKY